MIFSILSWIRNISDDIDKSSAFFAAVMAFLIIILIVATFIGNYLVKKASQKNNK